MVKVIARLQPGVSLAQAESKLQLIADRLGVEYPQLYAQARIRLSSLHDRLVRGVRGNLWLLLGAVGFVLMIACTNLANLQLARGVVRKRDSAIRTALGSSRRQLVRHLLAESLLLALLGGILGLILASWGVSLLKSLAEQRIPLLDRVGIDVPVLAFTLVSLLLAGIVFGLLPDLPPRTSPPSKLDLGPLEVHSPEQNRVLVTWGVWPPAPEADRPRRCEAVSGCTPFATSRLAPLLPTTCRRSLH